MDLGLLGALASLESDLIDIEKNSKESTDEFVRSIALVGLINKLKKQIEDDCTIIDDGKRQFIIHMPSKYKNHIKALKRIEIKRY